MAKFIKCNVEKVQKPYVGDYFNNPVNIDLCTCVRKFDQPDGYGKKFPSIIFDGCGVTWYYNEKDEKIRNEMWEQILKTFG